MRTSAIIVPSCWINQRYSCARGMSASTISSGTENLSALRNSKVSALGVFLSIVLMELYLGACQVTTVIGRCLGGSTVCHTSTQLFVMDCCLRKVDHSYSLVMFHQNLYSGKLRSFFIHCSSACHPTFIRQWFINITMHSQIPKCH